MDKARTIRFTRIRKFDQKKLDAVVNELRTLEQTLAERTLLEQTWQDQLSDSLTRLDGSSSVSTQEQSIAWAARVQGQLVELQQHLQSLKAKRTELLENIRQQKARVKGWDLLLENIAIERAAADEKEEVFVADDRFLSEIAAKNRSIA